MLNDIVPIARPVPARQGRTLPGSATYLTIIIVLGNCRIFFLANTTY